MKYLCIIFACIVVLPANELSLLQSIAQVHKTETTFLAMLRTDHKTYVDTKRKKAREALKRKRLQDEKIRLVKENEIKVKLAKLKQKRIEIVAQLQIIEEKKREVKRKAIAKRKRNHIAAKVNISQQRIRIYKGEQLLHNWKVSTGKNGHRTPTGKYKPNYIQKMHYSRKYNNSPMPYSVFFHHGYAIHGTKSVSRLGRRASHGCVRLRTSNAKKLYNLIRKYGKDNTSISIVH